MARVKRGVIAGRRHKKILKKAKGYYNARRKVFRTAKQAVIKAGQYAYRGRREKKREFRALWITRINAAARLCGLTYSTMIDGLNKAGLAIDRKVLADLAVHDMPAFTAIAEKAKASLSACGEFGGFAGDGCAQPSPAVFKGRPWRNLSPSSSSERSPM
jgi:large subunit ribosomal protein L20